MRRVVSGAKVLGAVLVAGVLATIAMAGVAGMVAPTLRAWTNPGLDVVTRPQAAWLDIAVLVFREGLECVLVLSAITASFTGATAKYRRPVAVGVAVGLMATVGTWTVASRIVDDLSNSLSALAVQAATGLLAVVVLLVVMNWFFHKVYWTGWIAAHTNRKRVLLDEASRAAAPRRSHSRVLVGLALLGFTSLYREGVEVVLFLQSYRLRLGPTPVGWGVAIGGALAAGVAVVTFGLQRRLPYRRMLVLTGVLLGGVLLVMVGEQAQEMQQAGWLSTTTIPWLDSRVPAWAGLWLSVFPTVETLTAQLLAAVLVLGSYVGASRRRRVEGVAAPAAHRAAEMPTGTFLRRSHLLFQQGGVGASHRTRRA
jgi:high-affinity iron transporter